MSQRFGSPPPYDPEGSERRKKRRLLSRSDEEIMEEMDASNLAYRAGWPTLPPLPVDEIKDGAKQAIGGTEEASRRLEEVRTILAIQGFSKEGLGCYFAYRIPRDAEDAESPDPEYLTLVVTVDTILDALRIDTAVLRIRSEFCKHASTKEVSIEFIDFRAVLSLNTFNVDYRDNDIIDTWEAVVEPKVLQILRGHEWLTVQLLRRGILDDRTSCPPTIIITTPTASNAKWRQKIVPSIMSQMGSIPPKFQVEILCGVSLLGHRPQYGPGEHINASAYVKDIRMGSSIGIAQMKGTGSLGGLVKLEGGPSCGLTNWHIVTDDRLKEIIATSTKNYLPVNHEKLAQEPQEIESPSTDDNQAFLLQLRNTVDKFKSGAAAGSVQLAMRAKEKEDELKKLEGISSRVIGKVYAGSGHRTMVADQYGPRIKDPKETYVFPLDWALIEVANTENRNVVNELSDQKLPYFMSKNINTKIVPEALCHRWSKFNWRSEEVLVAKYGRTTGWTWGHINSSLVRIHPSAARGFKEMSKVFDFTDDEPGKCFEVSNRIIGQPYLEGGDSGSISVHDGSDTQLGLNFGVTSAGTGLMLPLDIVFQDIRTVTGKQIVEPVFVDPSDVGLD